MSLKELSATFAEAKKKMMEEGTLVMKQEFSKVFENHPELTCIKWCQCTPYFNDGSTCEFSVNDFYISNAKDPTDVSYYGEYEGDDCEESEDKIFVISSWEDKEKKYKDIWDIENFAQSDIGSDIFLDCFGDHASITVTKDSIEVEEYEHD